MSVDDAYDFLLRTAGDAPDARRDVFDAYIEVRGRGTLHATHPAPWEPSCPTCRIAADPLDDAEPWRDPRIETRVTPVGCWLLAAWLVAALVIAWRLL